MNKPKCVYCIDREATERDHVPPKSLFPKPAPANLITVPACSKCNRGLSKDEEYFRTIVSQLAQTDKHPASKRLLKEKILKGLERRPKLASKIQSTVVPVDLTYQGNRVTTVAAFNIDNPSFDAVMTKILKGLVYHETARALPAGFPIKRDVMHKPLELPPGLYRQMVNAPVHVFGDRIFEYQVYFQPGSFMSFWVMRFFAGASFYASIFEPR